MATFELPANFPGFTVTEIIENDTRPEINAISTSSEAVGPTCGIVSGAVHSYYHRKPADLPVLDRELRLRLTFKRFRCKNEACSQVTFAEQAPHLISPRARRTNRLRTGLGAIAFALGGQAGSRLAAKLKAPVSRNTLLRILRSSPSITTADEPVVIGVDDWAMRRGQVYGTILVDLERHRVIDLLPDRTAETLSAWLQKHPSIKAVARDRSSEYARGITLGAPQAEQVADRFHLLVNLREAIERLIDRLRPELKTYVPQKNPEKAPDAPVIRRRHRSREQEAAKEGSRLRRQAVFDEVHQRHMESQSIRAIAKDMNLSRTTVLKYLSLSSFPQAIARKRRPSILEPYEDYLVERWLAGCRNANGLWREIREKGFPGSLHQVTQWVYERRTEPAPNTPKIYLAKDPLSQAQLGYIKRPTKTQILPAARRLVWLFLKTSSQLSAEELDLRDHLLNHPMLAQSWILSQPTFRTFETGGKRIIQSSSS